jgi:choline dehydrogenase-like flavoprotein
MLVDARTVPDGARIECDIAIVGAGAAGLTIARQFIGSGRNVCLVESGGFDLDPDTQALYDGDNVGLPYFPLDSCRLRQFGGTTNHWGGVCLPFKRRDFEQHSWLPHSGWPIDLDDMQPHIERAAAFLELPEAGWDIDHWEQITGEQGLSVDQAKLFNQVLLARPVRMGQVLRQEFERARGIHVYLNGNVVEIETTERASHVTGLRVQTLAGNQLTVVGGVVVLAVGGIENPRLLLLSDRVQTEGLGNAHDLVGRYFMEHATFRGGIIQPASPGVDVDFYRKVWFDNLEYAIRSNLMLTPEVREAEEIAPVIFDIALVYDSAYQSDGAQSLRDLKNALVKLELPDDLMGDVGNILSDLGTVAGLGFDRVWYDQPPIERIDVQPLIISTPNPDSRVLLGDQTDALGCRRVKLDWRLSEIDKRSARRGLEILATEIGRLEIGRMKITLSADDTSWPDDLVGVYHHLGTTRMHEDPRQGVVDRDGRVHGIDNLYIAGSSVFPTAGSGTPTMMIIALAMRLADHLRGLAA